MSGQSNSSRRHVFNLGSRVQSLSLEDMYYGTYRKLCWQKTDDCAICEGSGHGLISVLNYQDCEECHERDNSPDSCQLCLGRRRALIPKDRCEACKGRRKVIKEEVYLEAFIFPGVQDGQIVTIEGTDKNGSLCVLDLIIKQIPHDRLTRIGNDLHLNEPLQLSYLQALHGFTIILQTLNKRKVVVKRPFGHMIKNNATGTVEGQGFTIFGDLTRRGDFKVKIKYELPDAIGAIHARTVANIMREEQHSQIVYDPSTGERVVVLDDVHYMVNNGHDHHEQSDEENHFMDIDDQNEGASGYDSEH